MVTIQSHGLRDFAGALLVSDERLHIQSQIVHHMHTGPFLFIPQQQYGSCIFKGHQRCCPKDKEPERSFMPLMYKANKPELIRD